VVACQARAIRSGAVLLAFGASGGSDPIIGPTVQPVFISQRKSAAARRGWAFGDSAVGGHRLTRFPEPL